MYPFWLFNHFALYLVISFYSNQLVIASVFYTERKHRVHNACRHLASICSHFSLLLLLLFVALTKIISFDWIFVSFKKYFDCYCSIFNSVIVIISLSVMNFSLNHNKMESNRNKIFNKKLYVWLVNMDRKK